ncbi:DNA primase [Flammeovirgaceae bacterium SG7u.111]|nr:DNA primase [Flammeovirgaceae bacterium SG7u.132]WPO35296.1 DNA primase [Flammeovirgaceae bacterium SG7u.111]
MRISEQTIRRVQEAADIVEVVEGYVSLKKKGTNWWALSPFKDEKTPSFSVNPAMGIYKCFSTGKGGDAFSFVMEMEGLTFIEAVRHLAKQYGIEIEEDEITPEQEAQQTLKDSVLIALRYAKDFYKNILLHNTEGKSVGLSYFKERGFRDETLQKFELGYSLNEWNALENDALKNGYKEEILVAAGLVVKKEEGKKYDRFRGRVMFPIHDVSGKVLGFGARTLKKDDKPKYLNSPESEVYHKSDVLYGMYQAKDAIRRQDNCYLVEGYTDVISLHQEGIDNVVAASGTSLTDGQIKLISRRTKNVTVLFDGDTAGIKASLRGVDMILAKGMDVRIVTFPEGQDPDSYVQEIGGEAFKKYLGENAKDFILFKTQLFLDETKNDPLKKAGVIRDIVESIVKIPDSIKRSVFFKECGKLLDIDEETLIIEANKIVRKEAQKQQQKESYQKDHEVDELLEKIESGQGFREAGARAEAPDEVAINKNKLQISAESLQAQKEQELLRILLLHGDKLTADNVMLSKVIFERIAEYEVVDEVSRKVLDFMRKELEEREVFPKVSEVFLIFQDSGIKENLVNLISDEGELHGWERKGVMVKSKDSDLGVIVYKAIQQFLLYLLKNHRAKVEVKMSEREKEIGMGELDEEQAELMRVYMNLNSEIRTLSNELGIVVT